MKILRYTVFPVYCPALLEDATNSISLVWRKRYRLVKGRNASVIHHVLSINKHDKTKTWNSHGLGMRYLELHSCGALHHSSSNVYISCFSISIYTQVILAELFHYITRHSLLNISYSLLKVAIHPAQHIVFFANIYYDLIAIVM